MSQNANAPRTVATETQTSGLVDVKSLVLLAILLAAGFILNMTLGNALAMVGIKPQFIIAAYALAILLTRASMAQSAIYAILSACVCQLTTSIMGLNFLTEMAGALTMCAIVGVGMKGGARGATPLIAAFLATLVSGALFAVIGTLIMGAALPTVIVKVPLVLGTAVFNAIVVQALYIPLQKVLSK